MLKLASFVDLMERRVAETPDALMIVDELDRTWSFLAFRTAVERVAQELDELGVVDGSRVAWQLPTWAETAVLIGALSTCGAVQISIPHIYRSHELTAALNQTAPELLVLPAGTDDEYVSEARSLARARGIRCALVGRGTLGSRAMLAAEAEAESAGGRADPPRLAPDVRWIFFTSGTSSAPKGVQHTDASVGTAGFALSSGVGLGSTDRLGMAFPIGHIGGAMWMFGSLLSGCGLLLSEKFGSETIEYLDRYDATLPGVVPAQHLAFLEAARANPKRNLFPHVRAYPCGGATKSSSLFYAMKETIGGTVVSSYGLTEHPIATVGYMDDPVEELAATEGRPSPGVDLSIHDPMSGDLCLGGVEGEIWIRGPHMFSGYLGEEGRGVDDGGYLHSGDLGYVDDRGFVVITGRLKDVIIRKGENISAKEVEDHLFEHPKVADVAVVGVPDDVTGERCCAVVVLRGGVATLDLEEMKTYLRSRGLMTQKWPEQIMIVDSLPRNQAGKVMKRDLVAEISG